MNVLGLIERLLPPQGRRRRLLIALGVSALVLGLLVARATLTTYGPDGQQASSAERTALMKRTVELVTQVMSYDAATVDDDIVAAKSHMTPSMQEDYERTLPSAAERRKQATSGVKVEARVSRDDGVQSDACPLAVCSVGIVSMTEDAATVAVFVNQYATAKSTENAVVNPTWEIVDFVKEDGDWIIARMEAP